MSEEKKSNSIHELMASAMEKIRTMADSNAIVGQPIQTDDGVTLIPVSNLSIGLISGGADFAGKSQKMDVRNNFSGGAGAAVKLSPMAFLVVKDGNVRLLPVMPPPITTVDRVVEMVPDLVDKVTDFIDKKTEEEDGNKNLF